MPIKSKETLLPDRLTRARLRLTPLSYTKFVTGEPQSGTAETLTPQQVQEGCFKVLGYLEDLHLIPAGTVLPTMRAQGEDIHGLEQRLDILLKPAREEKPAEKQEVETETFNLEELGIRYKGYKRNEAIGQRISELLAIPQIRERFGSEAGTESEYFRSAFKSMREISTFDRISRKLKQAIYRTFLDDSRKYGKITQAGADSIRSFQEELDALELRRSQIMDTASPATLGFLKTQELLEYKREIKENGFAMVPSRVELLDRIRSGVISGKKIFLLGPLGTGKSRAAMYFFDETTGGYEYIPWHESSNTRDVHGYPRIVTEPGTGNPVTSIEPGPYPKAKASGKGLLHEEITNAPMRTVLALKPDLFQDDSIYQIFTGNPKDERTRQRADMDPAVLRELTGLEVPYMSAKEMFDLIRANLMEESGILELSKSEVNFIRNLTNAANMMQRIHNREFDEFTKDQKKMLGIDADGNTDTTLNVNFLDPGTTFKLFSEWKLARARGQTFAGYMNLVLGEFIRDPKTLSAPEERKTLQKILHYFNLISSPTGGFKVEIDTDEKGYILPSEMAKEDMLSDDDPMGKFSAAAGKTERPAEDHRLKEDWYENLISREKKTNKQLFGREYEIASMPEFITQDVYDKLQAQGFDLFYIPDVLNGINFPKNISLGGRLLKRFIKDDPVSIFLEELNAKNPYWKHLEALPMSDRSDLDVTRNLQRWYWDQIYNRKIEFPDLPGQWYAVETLNKPSYGVNRYADTLITSMLGMHDRFNHSQSDVKNKIQSVEKNILELVGLPETLPVRLPYAIEWNVFANRQGWGKTKSYEYVEDNVLSLGKPEYCLKVGGADEGGASHVDPVHPENVCHAVGCRLIIPLGKGL